MDTIDYKKRFWVFGMWTYYPSGGLGDIYGTFDTLEDARTCGRLGSYDHVYIFDADERIEFDVYTEAEQFEKKQCPHVFKKGENMGKQCIKRGLRIDNWLCCKHRPRNP